MKSTFVIETPRIPRGRATTIKIHSIPHPPFAPRLIPFISPLRDSGGCVYMCVCLHTTWAYYLHRWNGSMEGEEGEGGGSEENWGRRFLGPRRFISPENWNRSDARVKTSLQSFTKVLTVVGVCVCRSTRTRFMTGNRLGRDEFLCKKIRQHGTRGFFLFKSEIFKIWLNGVKIRSKDFYVKIEQWTNGNF